MVRQCFPFPFLFFLFFCHPSIFVFLFATTPSNGLLQIRPGTSSTKALALVGRLPSEMVSWPLKVKATIPSPFAIPLVTARRRSLNGTCRMPGRPDSAPLWTLLCSTTPASTIAASMKFVSGQLPYSEQAIDAAERRLYRAVFVRFGRLLDPEVFRCSIHRGRSESRTHCAERSVCEGG
ncbi:hypothetical protein LZ32DRAFT_621897 [Colletotrichum eremochloae]|nr:hypothetical protein LZ32DRAFT_621897 [Colletotrichum eremochloae]